MKLTIVGYNTTTLLIYDPGMSSNAIIVPTVEATVLAVQQTLQKHIEIFEECHDRDTQVRPLGFSRKLKARPLTRSELACSGTPFQYNSAGTT